MDQIPWGAACLMGMPGLGLAVNTASDITREVTRGCRPLDAGCEKSIPLPWGQPAGWSFRVCWVGWDEMGGIYPILEGTEAGVIALLSKKEPLLSPAT